MGWNVAGLRAVLKLERQWLQEIVETEDPDIICLQETKIQVGEFSFGLFVFLMTIRCNCGFCAEVAWEETVGFRRMKESIVVLY